MEPAADTPETDNIASVGKAIAVIQAAGYGLRSDGEGLWHINEGGGLSSAALIVFAQGLQDKSKGA